MKRMISGIKPTGKVTLGNYLGAIKPFTQYQDQYDLFVFVADLHALTIYVKPEELKENIDNLIAIYLAAGLDPDKCTIFKQSDVPAHTQLEWILTCNTNVSDLTKMPQYKNYLDKQRGESTPCGILMYPSLMSADILLADADYVPVGIDQKPHVDLTRDVAENFNKRYNKKFFKLPEAVVSNLGAKIMSLSDPSKKMSKSESDKGTIYLLDDVEISRKKIMKAVTDSEGKIYYDPINKPGISNLITIYAILKNLSRDEVEELYRDEKDYGKFKRDVADVVCDEILKIQTKVKQIKGNLTLKETLFKGAKKASIIAEKKIDEAYKIIGLK